MRRRVPSAKELLAPRLLPILYLAAAHAALVAAFGALAFDPARYIGFFFHPRMVAVVHLITLGWISSSILGAIYVVGPVALRMPMPARRPDYAACACFVVGVAGMVSHFWIERYEGMAWSAIMVVIGIGWVGARALSGLRVARIPSAVKAHVALAFFNIIAAGFVGTLLGLDKDRHFLPGGSLSNASAHAHLAALGWAGMMIIGIGYRLIPMLLPSAMPSGRSLWASALLLEVAAAGLFVTLASRSVWVSLFSVAAAGGFGAFACHAVWMGRRRRPAPPPLLRPDYGLLHVGAAMLYLLAAAALGVVLSVAQESEWSLKCAGLYGVLGLAGFLSQMVVGIGAKLVPLFAATQAIVRGGVDSPPPRPQEMPSRSIQAAMFVLWTVGVPLLAIGIYSETQPLLAAGAWSLLVASILGVINFVVLARQAFAKRASRLMANGSSPRAPCSRSRGRTPSTVHP